MFHEKVGQCFMNKNWTMFNERVTVATIFHKK